MLFVKIKCPGMCYPFLGVPYSELPKSVFCGLTCWFNQVWKKRGVKTFPGFGVKFLPLQLGDTDPIQLFLMHVCILKLIGWKLACRWKKVHLVNQGGQHTPKNRLTKSNLTTHCLTNTYKINYLKKLYTNGQ